ncbi:hypothetical protein L279_09635 [Mannheimia haemolytica D38]|nr:hypothetical protein L279_09635 [Mannheimia haemolytica D38]
MSNLSNWSYTAKATLWQAKGKNDDGVLVFLRHKSFPVTTVQIESAHVLRLGVNKRSKM